MSLLIWWVAAQLLFHYLLSTHTKLPAQVLGVVFEAFAGQHWRMRDEELDNASETPGSSCNALASEETSRFKDRLPFQQLSFLI